MKAHPISNTSSRTDSPTPLRRSLRNRRQVTLSISVVPHKRKRTTRRKKPLHVGVEQIWRRSCKLQCLQEILPGLFVAFADNIDDETYIHGAEEFTHIIHITPDSNAGIITRSIDHNGVHKLHLTVPHISTDHGRTHCSPRQLLATRDLADSVLRYRKGASDSLLRLLVTTHSDRAVDAMSVLGCYLAFASGREVHEVFMCINEEDVLDQWHGTVSADGMDYINQIARISSAHEGS